MQQNEKFLYRFILFIVFPVLFCYAALFCNERLYGDSAGYLYSLIQRENFYIVHSRPASVFIEWLPLLFIKFNASLQSVIYAFSFAECIYFFAWFIVFSKVLKAPGYGIAIVLGYLFGLRWNYFNPVSELVLAFPFALLLYWYWQRPPGKQVWWYAISIGLSVFLLFSHPLYSLVVPVLFVYSHYNQLLKPKSIFYLICLLGIGVVIYLMLDGYEKGLVNNEYTSKGFQYKQAFKLLLNWATVKGLGKAYLGIGLLALVCFYYLFKQKEWYRFLLLVGFSGAYFIYVWLKYNEYYPYKFEPLERYIFLIPIVIVTVTASMLASLNKVSKYGIALLLLYHLATLGYYGTFVQFRYGLLANAINNSLQFKENKVIYRIENYCYDMAMYPGHSWTMFYESLLVSSATNKFSSRQVGLTDVASEDMVANAKPGTFISNYQERVDNVSVLNANYFTMSAEGWRIANTDSVQTGLDTIIPKIKIVTYSLQTLAADEYYVTDAGFYNPTKVPLFSGTNKQMRGIGYRWKNTADGTIVKGLYTTRLMCDLYTHVKQKILIFGPPTPGTYELILGYNVEKPDTFIAFSMNSKTIVKVGERLKKEQSKLYIPVP